MTNVPLTGGCACRRIRFSADGPPELVAACHCNSCRRHTGAPVAVYADYQLTRVAFEGAPPDWFEVAPGKRRGFCARCGSSIAYQGDNLPDMIHLHVGVFDHPDAFPPASNEHTDTRLPWLHLLFGPEA